MRQWFVTPEEVKLPLFDDGQCWITVRKQLTAGEEKRLATGALKRMSPTGAGTDTFAVAYDVDFEAAAFNKCQIATARPNPLTRPRRCRHPSALCILMCSKRSSASSMNMLRRSRKKK